LSIAKKVQRHWNTPHELELPIWWYKADRSRRVEVVKSDTLVESAIVQLNGVAAAFLIFVNDKFVIETKFAFGCPG